MEGKRFRQTAKLALSLDLVTKMSQHNHFRGASDTILAQPFLGIQQNQSYAVVHIVFGSHMRPCKPCALDLTIANTWVRF